MITPGKIIFLIFIVMALVSKASIAGSPFIWSMIGCVVIGLLYILFEYKEQNRNETV